MSLIFSRQLQAAARGGLGGLAATVPMTAAMMAMHEQLPWWQKQPLPPRQITKELAAKAGVIPSARQPRRDLKAATLLNHFGYGTGTGVLYGVLSARLGRQGAGPGTIYGLGVWTASYLGWLPLFNFKAAATHQPWQRNAMMIAAHVVWGAALGWVHAALTTESECTRDSSSERCRLSGRK